MDVRFPPERSESLTAVGVLVRMVAGRTVREDPMISLGADLLDKKLPVWNVEMGDIDFYYWYYGTQAMNRIAGKRKDRWHQAIETALLDHQQVDQSRDEYGSWDPVDPWSYAGGRVYATALNTLTLLVERQGKGK